MTQDAREFLTSEERQKFDRIYKDFDGNKLEKDWEWKDVDPLALFSAQENRIRRREVFLHDYVPSYMRPHESEPEAHQLPFRGYLLQAFPDATVYLTSYTAKLVLKYDSGYELRNYAQAAREALVLAAKLGLKWSELGGTQLYIYNGPIFVARYSAGFVMLGDPDIDAPR